MSTTTQSIEAKIFRLRNRYIDARAARNLDEVIRLEGAVQDAMEELRLAQLAERAA